jgi:hypothetical protein
MSNFYQAALRHLNDGDLLHSHSRNVSATHLWAYGAECVIKAIAHNQGHFSLHSGKPDQGFGVHLGPTTGKDLLSIYNAKQAGTNAVPGPALAFNGWDITIRYEDGIRLQPVAVYCADARIFRTMLDAALANGLLP